MRFALHDEDVGNVELYLKEDHTFDLGVEISITAQIEIEGDVNEDIEGVDEKYTGLWEVIADKVFLRFEGNPELDKLFNPQLDPYHTTKIVNENTVSFDKSIESITVRGVYCEKI